MTRYLYLITFVTITLYSGSSFAWSKAKDVRSETSFNVDYEHDQFLLDGKPFRYISGSIHYFRIHPSQWKDRLLRVRALGFNAIQYYIPWNFHEIYEGKLLRVRALGFNAIQYYIPWNFHEIYEGKFKKAVDKWYSVLLPLIKPMMRHNGGPVLMLQVENEYADGNSLSALKCGSVPYTLTTVDFGPTSNENINKSFILQKKFLPNDMYSLGANINFYMIHGGTNFGFWSGSEAKAPCITSYDYFAPISEAGDVTPKYLAIRSWIKSIPDWKLPPLDVPSNNP
ncbi:glycosyl hydrolase family 35 [Teladorsagia circumcincta]|uniref:Glycosyl hydrolase family 35 n=1 Tax=Teladorsagia circumcincta TaxID=45464 RepID=A0A2G9UL59_TELCI|nr:glycosyl hydrolase family 35 [Teladorsagia circumcincta]